MLEYKYNRAEVQSEAVELSKKGGYACVEPFTPDRHLRRVEGIFHNCVCVNLVDLLQNRFCSRFDQRCEKNELCAYKNE